MNTKAVSTINNNPEAPKDKNNNKNNLGKISSNGKNNTTMIAVTKIWFVCRFCQRAYEFKEGLLKHKRQLHRQLLPSYKRKKEAAKEKNESQVDSQKSGGKTTTDNGVKDKNESDKEDVEEKQNKKKTRKNSEEKNDDDALENDTNKVSLPQLSTLKRRFSERIKEVGEKPVNEPPPYKLRKKAGEEEDKDNVDIPTEKTQQKPEDKETEQEEKETDENDTTRSDNEDNDDEEEEEKEKEEPQIEERDIKVFAKKKPRPSEAEILLLEASDLLSPIGRRSCNREPRKASLNKDYKDPINTLKNKFVKRKGVKRGAVGTKNTSPKKR